MAAGWCMIDWLKINYSDRGHGNEETQCKHLANLCDFDSNNGALWHRNKIYQAFDTQAILACTCHILYCLYISRRCSESKPDPSSSPYEAGDVNQPWPTGITPIPRASTNWDAPPPIEMAEGGSTHALVDKKHQTNGSVSHHMFERLNHLLLPLRLTVLHSVDRPLNRPLVCSVSPHHLSSRLHLLTNLNLTQQAWIWSFAGEKNTSRSGLKSG